MTDHDLAVRNAAKLAEINPAARPKFKAVLTDLQTHGWRPRIQCAFRSKRDQMAAFRSGASRVTWGYHNAMNAHGAPDALAADILDDDNPLDPPAKFKGHLRASARVHGLAAPLDWDPCHVQITGISIEEARQGLRP